MFDPFDTLGPVWMTDPVVRPHPLNQGRIAWWLTIPGLDGGRQWFDLMGLRHGTMTSMTTSASGWRGTTRPGGLGAVLFDGTNDSVDTPTLGFNAPPVTVAAWVYPKSLGNYRGIYCGAGGVGTFVLSGAVGNPLGYLWTPSADEYNATSGLFPTLNAWNFVAMAVTAAAATLYLGAAGGPIASWTNTKSHTLLTMGAAQIGSERSTAGRYWDGPIDDVSAWNRALSAAEVQSCYDLSRAGYPGMIWRRSGMRAATMAPAASVFAMTGDISTSTPTVHATAAEEFPASGFGTIPAPSVFGVLGLANAYPISGSASLAAPAATATAAEEFVVTGSVVVAGVSAVGPVGMMNLYAMAGGVAISAASASGFLDAVGTSSFVFPTFLTAAVASASGSPDPSVVGVSVAAVIPDPDRTISRNA